MRVVATAGHVDHGKSSLVRALTGIDPDRFEEEQRRGLTIDLGFAHMTLPSGEGISFIDVPGHVRFIRNMLAGVGGVDACVLVIAATEGWKPQTEEHLRILELLGVRHGVVVMTMTDLVDDEWLQLQQLEVSDHLAGSFLADAPLVAFSNASGDGLEDVLGALDDLVRTTPAAVSRERPRLWIDRVFAAKGSGTVVTGTLTGGEVRVDQHLDVWPLEIDVRVRSVQTHGARVDALGPGNRAALNLAGVDHDQLARGDALVVAEQWRPTQRFDASLRVLGALDHDVSRRGAYVAYIGSGEVPVRLRVLGSQAIAPGADGLVRIHLQRSLPLLPGDRFVLRESGRSETVGGGEVLDVAPALPASKARPDRSIERVLRERGVISTDDLAALTGAPVDALPGEHVGRWMIDPVLHLTMQTALLARIDAAGATGLDTAVLDEPQRALLGTFADVHIDGGIARRVGFVDSYADHPFTAALRAGGVAPPDPVGVTRNELRELIRRGLIVERDGICFHPDTIDAAAQRAAQLLLRGAEPAGPSAPNAAGFTMSQFREALGTSRKYALPLLNELDARGVTRRRGDVRIAGPRLPPPASPDR
ncbi:MAG: selB [Ilumatobacteraceae bacterium]|nr:selB [Ilumatobacteraceae bacterium]